MVPFVILAIEDPVKRVRYQDAYTKYNQHLIAVAMSLLKDKHLAEDALHDAFEAVIKADVLPEDGLAQKAFLTTIVKHKALDILKHQRFLADDEPTEEQLGFTSVSEKAELDMIIDSLPNIYQEVILLYYENDLSVNKIAGILGISQETVRKRLERARKLLSKAYWEES
jgi:RNA polymerase sigma-70 factor (ECF subfamily)